MEKLQALLAQWRTLVPQQVALGKLKTDPKFQPRDASLATFRDRGRLEEESRRHVEQLARALYGGAELEPLLVARIEGKLVVVDGHHRLMAYRRERRQSAPVRILETTEKQALLVSKLVNCGGAKLPMHAEQQRECAWQYLAYLTLRGCLPLPDGNSTRSLGAAFGVSHDTIHKMLRKLPKVDMEEYQASACDPGTGWPRWKYVKGNAWRDLYADVPQDIHEQHGDTKRAAQIAKLIEKDGMDAVLRAIHLLKHEALVEAAEELANVLGGTEGDY